MSKFLFKIGNKADISINNETVKLLIIGKCVPDNDGVMHDYAGVEVSTGYRGKIIFFEHREILDINQ